MSSIYTHSHVQLQLRCKSVVSVYTSKRTRGWQYDLCVERKGHRNFKRASQLMHAVLNSYYRYYWSLVRIILFRLLVISVDCNAVRLQFIFLRQLHDDKLQTLIISSFVFSLQNKENKQNKRGAILVLKGQKKILC